MTISPADVLIIRALEKETLQVMPLFYNLMHGAS